MRGPPPLLKTPASPALQQPHSSAVGDATPTPPSATAVGYSNPYQLRGPVAQPNQEPVNSPGVWPGSVDILDEPEGNGDSVAFEAHNPSMAKQRSHPPPQSTAALETSRAEDHEPHEHFPTPQNRHQNVPEARKVRSISQSPLPSVVHSSSQVHIPPDPPSPVPGFDRILSTFLSTRGAPAAARLHHYIEARGGSAAGLEIEILDLIERMLGEEEEEEEEWAARPVEAGVRWWGERVGLMRVERGVGDGLREVDEEEDWEEDDDEEEEEEEEEEECECENEAERTPYATSSARRGYENGLFRHFDILAAYEEGVWKGGGRAYRTFLNPYNADYESPYYATPLPHTHNPYIPTGPRGL